ncbi:MAG: amidohydrolase family protein [Actinomycetes bacterium]
MNVFDNLNHPVFDADNHYYEALDAFTRHLDPSLGTRCVQWCEINGRNYHVLGGQVSRAVTNPTFNPIAKPGALYDYFRGNTGDRNPLELLADREPIRPEYRNPVDRTARLNEQGLSACWMFPTLAMIYEDPLKHDPVAVCHMFRAFNRWLHDDWSFNHEDRIFAAPYLTLADANWAIEELTWALDLGARTIVMRPAAPTTVTGQVSPFDTMFDGFWQLANDAGITVVLHAGDGGVSSNGYAVDGFAANFTGAYKPSIKAFDIERAINDYLTSMVLEKHLVRFPNLRIAAVENGAEFLPELFRKVRSSAKKLPGYFADDPIDTFREHVWINPFWEDNVYDVIDLMGPDRVLFGSDWPHIEALPEPSDYVVELKDLDDIDRRKVLFDNVTELTARRPT